MRKLTGFSIVAVLLIALGSHIGRVHAQAPGPSLIYANGPISTCPVLPIPNSGGLLCVANDHVVFAPAGAVKYLQLDGQSVVSAPGTHHAQRDQPKRCRDRLRFRQVRRRSLPEAN